MGAFRGTLECVPSAIAPSLTGKGAVWMVSPGKVGFRLPVAAALVRWAPCAGSAWGCLTQGATARNACLQGRAPAPTLTEAVARGVMHERRVVNLERGIPLHSRSGSASGCERMVCKLFMFVPVAVSRPSYHTCGGGHHHPGGPVAGGGRREPALAAGRVARQEPYGWRAPGPLDMSAAAGTVPDEKLDP